MNPLPFRVVWSRKRPNYRNSSQMENCKAFHADDEGTTPRVRAAEEGMKTEEGVCPRCENQSLFKRHCKIVCEQCGTIRDCSDPFR